MPTCGDERALPAIWHTVKRREPEPTLSNTRRRAHPRSAAALVGSALLLLGGTTGAGAQSADLEKAVGLRTESTKNAASSQNRIDKLSDQTDDIVAEYRSTLDQIESLRVYNRQLEELLAAQNAEIDSLGEQIDNVTLIGREVTPLMLRMVDALDAFIALDVPFLPNERRERVANLRELMDRADVTDSEKYRRIVEAYQIENDYGRNLQTYQGELGEGEDARTVNFLRLGRVSLVYQTLDGKEAGAWDQEQRQWVPLSNEYRQTLRKGMRIARNQAAPDLLRLPVLAPTVAASGGGQ